LKVLAELVLVCDARITALSDALNLLMEREIDASGNDVPRANALRSSFEQSEALSRDAEVARAEARKFFGLEP
jgi:hypothetical protein